MSALIGPNHGEAGIGSTGEAGRDPLTGEAYATDRKAFEAIVADLTELRSVVNKLRADLSDARTKYASMRTLVNETKADVNSIVTTVSQLVELANQTKSKHNSTDTATNAGAQQVTKPDAALAGTEAVVAADASALAAATATADAAALQTQLATKP